jgi:hypothetical protein
MPGPPAALASRKVSLVEFEGVLFRSHQIKRNPVHYGKSRIYRFDAPDGSYGVLFAGRDAYCAFIETFARSAGARVVTTAELEARALSELKATRPLKLIDLMQSGALARIGAESRLFAGDYGAARLWSNALHEHPAQADGLIYPSRLDPVRQAIVWDQDRAPKLVELSRQGWYAPGPQRRPLVEIIEHYKLDLIESHSIAPRKPPARARQEEMFDWFQFLLASKSYLDPLRLCGEVKSA